MGDRHISSGKGKHSFFKVWQNPFFPYFCTPKKGKGFIPVFRVKDSVAQLVEHPDFIGRVLGEQVLNSYDSVAQLVEHPDFIGRVLGEQVLNSMIP